MSMIARVRCLMLLFIQGALCLVERIVKFSWNMYKLFQRISMVSHTLILAIDDPYIIQVYEKIWNFKLE